MVEPHDHKWGSFLLTMAVQLINAELDQLARTRTTDSSLVAHLTLVETIVACVKDTDEGANPVCEFLIDKEAFIHIIHASQERTIQSSSGRRETTVLPVSVSVGDLAHAQIWLVSWDIQGQTPSIRLLDPNGHSYKMECAEKGKYVYITNKKFVLRDRVTKQLIEPKYKPRFCKLYIPCSYEHSFCWIVCIALLAKNSLTKTIYVGHGFPDAIKSKYDLQSILHAIIDDKLCVVPPCNCQQPPTNTIKIIVKR